MDDPAHLSAAGLQAGYAAGTFSPVDVTEALLARIARLEPVLNAFYVVEPDDARAAAAASAARWAAGAPLGELDGVPVTVKENVATAGVPRPSGTALGATNPPEPADGPAAAFLAAAGAVRLGKTTMPDHGMLSSGVSSLHGITRNPWNPQLSPGGSSAGAAAAAAAGIGVGHVGSDIGGSLRLPASWTGTVALKPTFGLMPVDPPYLGRCVGPLARTVDDVALLAAVMAQPDDRDPTYAASSLDWAAYGEPLEVSGLRMGFHLEAGCGTPTDPSIAAAVADAADVFRAAGAHVEVLPPFMTPALLAGLDRFLAARSWHDLRPLTPEQRGGVLPFVVAWAATAAGLSGSDVIEAYQQVRALAAATVVATRPYDVVLSPVSPAAAFPATWHMPTDDPVHAMDHIGFTAPYNFSEQPALSLNCGWTADGRPVGVQLAARRADDVRLLRVARWLEAHRPPGANPRWPDRPAPAETRGRPPGDRR